MCGQGRIAGRSGCVWGHKHAKWERASPSCGLKVVAEQGFWFLWVPYLAAAGILSVLMGLWQKVGNQLSGWTGLCCIMVPEQHSNANLHFKKWDVSMMY